VLPQYVGQTVFFEIQVSSSFTVTGLLISP